MLDLIKELLDYNPETGIFTWKVKKGTRAIPGKVAGNINYHGYMRIGIQGKSYKAHRLAWLIFYGTYPEQNIDHINGIKTDNRICNLREATTRENGQNRREHRNGSLVGTCYHRKAKRWVARILVKGKRIYLGSFATEELAYIAYQNYIANHLTSSAP